LTTDPSLVQIDPLGVTNNGSYGGPTGSTISINVNPQEQTTIYYYSSVNPSKMFGSISVVDSGISDLGNISLPLFNNQIYSGTQNLYMQTAISNFIP
jgi:hypothetical protein